MPANQKPPSPAGHESPGPVGNPSPRSRKRRAGSGEKPPRAKGSVLGSFRARAVLLAGILLLASGLTFDPKLYINGDNVDYILLAQGILREGTFWGSPTLPPLFPMLLAPIQAIFGAALLPQKMLVLGMYLAAGPLLMRLTDRALAPVWSLTVVAGAMITVPMLEFSHYVMSEIPFFFFSLAALWAGERALDRMAPRPAGIAAGQVLLLLPFFLLAGLAFYTRTIGGVLLAAFPIVLLLKRRWSLLLLSLALGGLVLLPWILRTYASGPDGDSYFNQMICMNPYFPERGRLDLAAFWRRVLANGQRYFSQEIPLSIIAFAYRSTYTGHLQAAPALPGWSGLPVAGLLLLSMIRAARRLPLAVVYAALFLAVCMLWPQIWGSIRFVLPILPLCFLFFAIGLMDGLAACLAARPVARGVMTAALGMVLVLGAHNAYLYGKEAGHYPPRWAIYFRAAEWAGKTLPAGSMILDRKPKIFTLVSGLPATTFPREGDDAKMLAFLRRQRVAYVHVASIPYDDLTRFLNPFLKRNTSFFEGIWYEETPEGAYGAFLKFHPEGYEEHSQL